MKHIILICTIFFFSACQQNNQNATDSYPDVIVKGAMKNVMWNGALHGVIKLDTIANKKGLYGLGPESYLTGELLIDDGQSFVSRVQTDTSMVVIKTFNVEAPFFVYANVNEWREVDLPDSVTDIKALQRFINTQSEGLKRPFAFKLTGHIDIAEIHVQNLPRGSEVHSPREAHIGQTNYHLSNKDVTIIGFFSTKHQGIFTHHDSYLHLHLITKDKKQMGHLDKMVYSKGALKLYLPLN